MSVASLILLPILTMKALSLLSARLVVPGLCLIAALAAACSFDVNKLRTPES
jgi:hypothetical protein